MINLDPKIKHIMISVCIPTYNGGKYIKEQLESILKQLGPNDEVIISDDCSTDDTIEIIKSFNDVRIKVYTHEKISNRFKGTYTNIYYVYKNVENALRYATGDYIFLSDQDDIWLDDKIETVCAELNRGADCVLHNNIVVNNEGGVLMKSYFDWTKPSNSLFRFLVRCFYQGASMAFTRKILELSLPFPNTLPISHDHWIACNSWTHGKRISFIKKPLLLYRRHGDNVSPSSEKSNNSLYFKISYRYNLLVNYYKSKRK